MAAIEGESSFYDETSGKARLLSDESIFGPVYQYAGEVLKGDVSLAISVIRQYPHFS